MTEAPLYNEILAAFSKGDTRLFRMNTGLSWQGTVLERTPKRLVLAYPRAIHMGVPGMSDIIGFTGPTFVAIEAKSARGRVTPGQQAFIDLVLRCGGRAGVARSVEEAGRIIRG